MKPWSAQLAHPSKTLIRGLAALGFVVGFLAVASVINPSSSVATNGSAGSLGSEDQPGPAAPPAEPFGTAVDAYGLGTLEGPMATLHIHAGPISPAWTLIGPEGNVLAERVPARELSGLLDGLDIESMQAVPLGAVEVDPDF